MVHLYFIFVGN